MDIDLPLGVLDAFFELNFTDGGLQVNFGEDGPLRVLYGRSRKRRNLRNPLLFRWYRWRHSQPVEGLLDYALDIDSDGDGTAMNSAGDSILPAMCSSLSESRFHSTNKRPFKLRTHRHRTEPPPTNPPLWLPQGRCTVGSTVHLARAPVSENPFERRTRSHLSPLPLGHRSSDSSGATTGESAKSAVTVGFCIRSSVRDCSSRGFGEPMTLRPVASPSSWCRGPRGLLHRAHRPPKWTQPVFTSHGPNRSSGLFRFGHSRRRPAQSASR